MHKNVCISVIIVLHLFAVFSSAPLNRIFNELAEKWNYSKNSHFHKLEQWTWVEYYQMYVWESRESRLTLCYLVITVFKKCLRVFNTQLAFFVNDHMTKNWAWVEKYNKHVLRVKFHKIVDNNFNITALLTAVIL